MYKFNKILIACSLLFIDTQDAFAYLDPGTGSYIIQLIIALVVGAAFSVKMFWERIVIFFKNIFKK